MHASMDPELFSIYVTAHDLYKIQRRGPTLGGGVVPQHATCRYPSKVCGNPRAFKANGELHRFCDYHRYRANVNQKRWSNSRRRYGARALIEPQMLMPKHDAMVDTSAVEAIEGFEKAFPYTDGVFEAFPVDMSLSFDDVSIDSLLQELLCDSPDRLVEDNSSQSQDNILV
ncbi:hypothetical protein Poli38472_006903 [Pythium oligandrum]|uniref:Uncharacterized protein n=1 Tax=Pythium oligandrum TaxID=41045 RepID=A0A8K1C990_PYTOL|nr:hypothetical protein Poli38472_006903 [Pythium oligandrum]|eukprot:TMW58758.1 hypothetical protein Poli38472_006903 [Pythium oligandrum]